jgi:hypothetical protein
VSGQWASGWPACLRQAGLRPAAFRLAGLAGLRQSGLRAVGPRPAGFRSPGLRQARGGDDGESEREREDDSLFLSLLVSHITVRGIKLATFGEETQRDAKEERERERERDRERRLSLSRHPVPRLSLALSLSLYLFLSGVRARSDYDLRAGTCDITTLRAGHRNDPNPSVLANVAAMIFHLSPETAGRKRRAALVMQGPRV